MIEDWCPICRVVVPIESHYHCDNCSEVSAKKFGFDHYSSESGFSCIKKSKEEKRANEPKEKDKV